jgi:hypothetical protein
MADQKTQSEQRKDRLAKALKANLAKRKAKVREAHGKLPKPAK